ncbi:MAG: NgoPII family restriction endonuclease [Clostridiales bacterium]|nr:NgoPII family restriction endonuclease [Clostridiales bacterium]
MCPNVLSAIKSIADFKINDLKGYSSTYLIRINAVGEQLEFYVKDAICNSFKLTHEEKERRHREIFSLLGNQNNPPDAIIRGGDAFEIKKIQSLKSSIALNSSTPKDMLHRDDGRITEACRNCEAGNWEEKDIFYVVGSVQKSKIKYLFFVHGLCYSAKREVYQRISRKLKQGIDGSIKAEGIEGSGETVELGRINRVDPLGITKLRIRGMWMIENPIRVFSYLHKFNPKNNFSLIALVTKKKFDSYSREDIDALSQNELINTKDVKIKNPNNPAELIDAKLITVTW